MLSIGFARGLGQCGMAAEGRLASYAICRGVRRDEYPDQVMQRRDSWHSLGVDASDRDPAVLSGAVRKRPKWRPPPFVPIVDAHAPRRDLASIRLVYAGVPVSYTLDATAGWVVGDVMIVVDGLLVGPLSMTPLPFAEREHAHAAVLERVRKSVKRLTFGRKR